MRIFKDIAVTTVSHGVSTLTVLLVQILLVRNVSIEAYGQFAFQQGLIALIESIVIARAGEVAIYWLGREWGSDFSLARGYSRFLFRREFLWASVVYLVILLVSIPISKYTVVDPVMFLLLGLSIPFQSGYGVTKSTFVVAGKIKEQAKFEIASSLVYLIVSSGLIIGFGLYGFILGSLTAALIKNLFSWKISQTFWPLDIGPIKKCIKKPPLVSVSIFSIFRNLMSNISNQADILILGLLAPSSSVALYRVAKTLSSIPTRIAAPVWAALRPSLIQAIRGSEFSKVRYLISLPAIIFLLTGLCTIPLFINYSGWIIKEVYGLQYKLSVTPFLTLMLGSWFYNMISGWIGFFAIIVPDKRVLNALFFLQGIAVMFCSILSNGSIFKLSFYIASTMITVSVLAWLLVLSSTTFMDFSQNK